LTPLTHRYYNVGGNIQDNNHAENLIMNAADCQNSYDYEKRLADILDRPNNPLAEFTHAASKTLGSNINEI